MLIFTFSIQIDSEYDTETILFSGGDIHLHAFGGLRGAENLVAFLSGREDRD